MKPTTILIIVLLAAVALFFLYDKLKGTEAYAPTTKEVSMEEMLTNPDKKPVFPGSVQSDFFWQDGRWWDRAAT